MKIAVVGLGAVGGLLAARLATAGHQVEALARGATLEVVRKRGLRVVSAGVESRSEIRVSDDASTLGRQDLVIVALKSQSLAAATPGLAALLGPETLVMPAMNGVPWWFLQSAAGTPPCDDRRLASVDPDGAIAAALPLERVLGCVVHLGCASPEPGVVRHGFGNRLIVGEPAGGASARVDTVCAVLADAGFACEASLDIRADIWFKLWGNMTMNPVSALTGATADRILADPLVRAFMLSTMREAADVGAQIGCPITQSGEARLDLALELGAFKTSMLQDVEAGRSIELDALVTAVHEIGRRVNIATPNIDALLGLTRLMARERSLHAA